jgi:hypothetical protein
MIDNMFQLQVVGFQVISLYFTGVLRFDGTPLSFQAQNLPGRRLLHRGRGTASDFETVPVNKC